MAEPTPCGRRVQIGTTISFWSTPGGMRDPIRVSGTKRGWHTLPARWGFHGYDDNGLVASLGWHPEQDVPIGHLTVRRGEPVMGPCPGTVDQVATGRTQTGIGWSWEGCDTCGWTRRTRDVEAVQEVLL